MYKCVNTRPSPGRKPHISKTTSNFFVHNLFGIQIVVNLPINIAGGMVKASALETGQLIVN